MKISFVIPTFQRHENLALVLLALCLQTESAFEVIVSDDGSTDGTEQLVKSFQQRLSIKYYWHEDKGYRVSLTRNQGTRVASQDSTHIWFVDSDVLLNREAVAFGRRLCEREPDAIICGRYDWLPPMRVTAEDMIERWRLLTQAKLPRVEVDYEYWKEFRRDHRPATLFDSKTRRCSRGTLSGNLIVPRQWLIRGFDENIEDQGQDGEFGHHIQELGAECIFCEKIIGYHLAHYTDLKWKSESVQRTIKYIVEKYNLKT